MDLQRTIDSLTFEHFQLKEDRAAVRASLRRAKQTLRYLRTTIRVNVTSPNAHRYKSALDGLRQRVSDVKEREEELHGDLYRIQKELEVLANLIQYYIRKRNFLRALENSDPASAPVWLKDDAAADAATPPRGDVTPPMNASSSDEEKASSESDAPGSQRSPTVRFRDTVTLHLFSHKCGHRRLDVRDELPISVRVSPLLGC